MKTPSEIKLALKRGFESGHLYLLKLEHSTFLAFSFIHQLNNRSFMLINRPKADGNRIVDLVDIEEDKIHDLGTNFTIKTSLNPDHISIGENNSPDNILVCAQPMDSNTTSYMFTPTPGDNNYIDIKTGQTQVVKIKIANVNFHSWEIVNDDGESIYSYPSR